MHWPPPPPVFFYFYHQHIICYRYRAFLLKLHYFYTKDVTHLLFKDAFYTRLKLNTDMFFTLVVFSRKETAVDNISSTFFGNNIILQYHHHLIFALSFHFRQFILLLQDLVPRLNLLLLVVDRCSLPTNGLVWQPSIFWGTSLVTELL